MKKIKKFKINVRVREVMRLFKATAENPEITPQLEEAIEKQTASVSKLLAPAAVYETFFKEKFPHELIVSPPDNWVAASLYLVTVGGEIERVKNEAAARGENFVSQIIHAIGLESLEQSANFVCKLIDGEAQEEGCDLSDRKRVNTADFYRTLFVSLPGDKIDVKLLDNNTLSPLYSSGGVIYWLPLKKKK